MGEGTQSSVPSFKRQLASAAGQATGSSAESPTKEGSSQLCSPGDTMTVSGSCLGSVPGSHKVRGPGHGDPQDRSATPPRPNVPKGRSPRRVSPKGTQHVAKRACSPQADPEGKIPNKGTVTHGDVTLFYGKPSTFSNFHSATFTLDGATYNCSEQYYCSEKALAFNAKKIAASIKRMKSPVRMKSTAKGHHINGYQQKDWYTKAQMVLTKACLAKFSQNPELRDELLATGQNRLAEASLFDDQWGIGMALDDPSAADPQLWKGTNWMGEILQKVRMILKDSPDLQITTSSQCEELLGNSTCPLERGRRRTRTQ